MLKTRYIEKNNFIAYICRKGKNTYLQKNAAEREKHLSAEMCRKALYIDVAAHIADAHVCRIGLKRLPYPKQMCINVSPCLSAKIDTLKKGRCAHENISAF